MLTRTYVWSSLALWLTILATTSAAFLSGWMSLPALGLANGIATLLVGVGGTVLRLGGPTRSVAHVLYDTEHQARAER